MIKYLIVFAILALILPAQADILWNQSPAASERVTSQEFSDLVLHSAWTFDDFTAGAGGWTVNKVFVYGYEWGYGGTPKLAFTSSANYSAIATTTTYTGTWLGTNLVFDLPDVYIGPGNSWITSWVERPINPNDRWFWWTTTTVNGSEAYWHQPLGGYGYGTSPIPLHSIVGPPAHDLAFKIEGRLGQPAVPEAGSLMLAISGIPAIAVFIRRRK